MRIRLPALDGAAFVAVTLVTLLTAVTVAAAVAAQRGRALPVANAPELKSPVPSPTSAPSPIPEATSSVQLSAPAAGVVWALVDYQKLFVSADGGSQWTQRSLPGYGGLRPLLSFISASEGWLLAPGSPMTECQVALADVWHTSDGAKTWQDMKAHFDESQCKDGIWFVDSKHGFVAASDPNHRPTVYRTSDGGDHWTSSTAPDNPIFVTRPGGFTLHVNWVKAFGQTVYLQASGAQDDASWHDRDFIYVSRDGGATWTWKQKIPSPYMFLITELRWLQLAPDIAVSVNGGQGFQPLETNLHVAPPMQAVFPDGKVGYLSAGGGFFQTLDGGVRWTQLGTPWSAPVPSPSPSPSPTPIVLPSSAYVSAPSANIVWALVGGSRLFVSGDRGASWQERTVPEAASASAAEVTFVDDSNGWMSACATSTTSLWRTTDGARSWEPVFAPFPPDQCMQSLRFVDRSIGFITARLDYSPPEVFRTADGGGDWSGSSIENPPGFQPGQQGYGYNVLQIVRFGGVYFLAAHGMLPTGDVGYVYRSTDAGVTWKLLATTPYPADSLAFVTATRWLQLMGPGQSLETTDGGKSWHVFGSDYSQAAPVAPQVVFGDALTGYASVRGSIERTTDGGVHWTPIKTPGT
jgi:photosystem II stability/assembly factor-like uncharacterized protein